MVYGSIAQRMQERAKAHVNKCKYAKKRKIIFADVCISSFWRLSHLQMFAYFVSLCCPPESLLSRANCPLKADYQQLIFADCYFCIGK
jgi:hypothetical protein